MNFVENLTYVLCSGIITIIVRCLLPINSRVASPPHPELKILSSKMVPSDAPTLTSTLPAMQICQNGFLSILGSRWCDTGRA